MKAVIIHEPRSITLTEAELPTLKEGEALLQVLYCGICGADVASYTGNQPFTTYPRIPGHEFSARIVSIGDNPKGLKIGDIVTANPYFNCGECYSCRRGFVNCCTDNQTMGVQRDGSFMQYITMPIERIYGGKGLDAKTLALIEPFSIGHHAISRGNVSEGEKVLIFGAGPIGLFALISAKLRGAKVYVTDILSSRLDMALHFGADGVFDSSTGNVSDFTERITGGDGFDVCVEACGQSKTFLACIDNVCFAGKVILIGNGKTETTFLHSVILKKELNIYGSRNSFKNDFEELISLVSEKGLQLGRMISRVYPVSRAADAFNALVNNDGSLSKVLIDMTDGGDMV